MNLQNLAITTAPLEQVHPTEHPGRAVVSFDLTDTDGAYAHVAIVGRLSDATPGRLRSFAIELARACAICLHDMAWSPTHGQTRHVTGNRRWMGTEMWFELHGVGDAMQLYDIAHQCADAIADAVGIF